MTVRARPAPHLVLKASPPQIEAGSRARFSYVATRVSARLHARLQRKVGGTWRNHQALHKSRGVVRSRGELSAGKHQFRLALLNHHGKVKTHTRPVTVNAATLSIHMTRGRVSQGQRAAFSYTVRYARGDMRLQLQRQMGSKHVWRRVKTLQHRSGTTTSPKLSMGRFRFRLALVDRHGNVRAASGSRRAYSYGRVPMSTLCDSMTYSYICGHGDMIDVGDNTFTYVEQSTGFAEPPYWDTVFSFPKTSCRSLHVRFAVEGPSGTGTASAQVIQAATDAQEATVHNGTIGTLNARLDGSPFDLRSNSTDAALGNPVFVNGYAQCWHPGGTR